MSKRPASQATRPAVVASLETLCKAVGQAEVEQRVRAGVEPVIGKTIRASDIDDRIAKWLGAAGGSG